MEAGPSAAFNTSQSRRHRAWEDEVIDIRVFSPGYHGQLNALRWDIVLLLALRCQGLKHPIWSTLFQYRLSDYAVTGVQRDRAYIGER
jgi:hypothetical protein